MAVVTVVTRTPRSVSELTRAVFGTAMTIDEALKLLSDPTYSPGGQDGRTGILWVGSIGYERYRLNTDLVARLQNARVERLIDVRQLPISRRRGYGKTALAHAVSAEGIEYVHLRALGNPKPSRDLYKAGRTAEGRAGYERYLLGEQRDALGQLATLLQTKRSALMCVEHDSDACHRAVILDALRAELDLSLDVGEIG